MFYHSWLVLVLLHSVLPQTTDKYSDEDRPYKFGFNIQGYQHRQEEKDERGLIKGEYGFITADGYYRVTVYATDENGDFRILSMKNYYVGFPPEDPTTTPGPSGGSSAGRRPPSFGSQQSPAGRALGGFGETSTTPKAFTRPQGLAACSDCSIPTTSPRTSQGLRVDTGDLRTGKQSAFGGESGGGQSPSFPQGSPRGQSPSFPQGSPRGQSPSFPQGSPKGQSPLFPQASPRGQSQQGRIETNSPSFPQGSPAPNVQTPGSRFNSPGLEGQNQGGNFGGGSSGTGPLGGRSPVSPRFGNPEVDFPRGRTDFTANNELGDSPNRRPTVGEVRDGLPPGVTLNDIKDLLYTFNYTVGFHGHHEDGYRNGDKKGDYFFDGRDGVERKVEYLANEFGYQPNITLIDLPENDVRRPNEQTEKEYGLKGYEFKWFYRK